MFEKLVSWFGKNFMAGSGYEKRLHEELIQSRHELAKTNRLLKDIKQEVTQIEEDIHKAPHKK